MLTPDDVLPPFSKSFVVSLQQYDSTTDTQSRPLQSATENRPSLGAKSHLHSRGCPFCGKQHISVQYFGHNHVCLNCRKYLKTADERKVRILLGIDDEIRAYARAEGEALEVEVDNQDLYILGVRCYATFGDESELIVLPYDI